MNLTKNYSTTYDYYYDDSDQRVYGTGSQKFCENGVDGKTEAVFDLSSPGVITHNIWGNDLIGQVRRNGSLTRYYHLKDHLGSVRVTVDAAGNAVAYDDYDPWGMLMDGRSHNAGQADNRYRFLSKEKDIETGIDWLDVRGYDSRIGKFLTPDPLRDAGRLLSWSPYHYSYDNPVRFKDPTGLDAYSAIPVEQREEAESPQPQEKPQSVSGYASLLKPEISRFVEPVIETHESIQSAGRDAVRFGIDATDLVSEIAYTTAAASATLTAISYGTTSETTVPIASVALNVGLASDAANFVLKMADMHFGGDPQEAWKSGFQFAADLVLGGAAERILSRVGAKIVTEGTGSMIRNEAGIRAVSDASKVLIHSGSQILLNKPTWNPNR